jgi:hypothetical protein
MKAFMTKEKIYQEEKGSTFTSDGTTFDLNYIFNAVHKQPIQHIHVSELEWLAEFGKDADPKRIEAADMNVPILVARYGDKELTVDGMHRLLKAIKNGVKTLPYRRVSKEVMKAAIVPTTKPALESRPVYMDW